MKGHQLRDRGEERTWSAMGCALHAPRMFLVSILSKKLSEFITEYVSII